MEGGSQCIAACATLFLLIVVHAFSNGGIWLFVGKGQLLRIGGAKLPGCSDCLEIDK